MLNSFGKRARGGWRSGASVGGLPCLGQDVGGKKREAEAEIWGREDGEGFDEDVRRGFVADKVGVELVEFHQRQVGIAVI